MARLWAVGAAAVYAGDTTKLGRFSTPPLGVLPRLGTSQPRAMASSPADNAIPFGETRCEEIQAAVDYFDQEFVFRVEVDNILSGIVLSPEGAPPNIRRIAVLAVRDQWSLCAIDAPPYAEKVAANSLSYDSPRASAVRASLKSQDVHAFDKETDSVIDILGDRTCIAARALQPISTTEIEQIAVGLIDRYGRMDTMEAEKVLVVVKSAYCPEVDLIGGS